MSVNIVYPKHIYACRGLFVFFIYRFHKLGVPPFAEFFLSHLVFFFRMYIKPKYYNILLGFEKKKYNLMPWYSVGYTTTMMIGKEEEDCHVT